MDICMLTPAERADLTALVGEFEEVKRKLQACLEKIEMEWTTELKNAPDPRPKTERTDSPMSRMQILTEWIGHLDEQCVQLEDMEEIVPRDPKPPVIKPKAMAYRIQNYTLPPAKREELTTLIAVYNAGFTNLLVFLKATHKEWEDHYRAEPEDCTNPDADEEIERRITLLEDWIQDVELNEELNIADLDN
jgi:hypothetical protein